MSGWLDVKVVIAKGAKSEHCVVLIKMWLDMRVMISARSIDGQVLVTGCMEQGMEAYILAERFSF